MNDYCTSPPHVMLLMCDRVTSHTYSDTSRKTRFSVNLQKLDGDADGLIRKERSLENCNSLNLHTWYYVIRFVIVKWGRNKLNKVQSSKWVKKIGIVNDLTRSKWQRQKELGIYFSTTSVRTSIYSTLLLNVDFCTM